MKVLIADQVDKVCSDVFRREGFEVIESPGLTLDALKEKIRDADALVVRSATQVTADVLAAGTCLKVIGRAGAGVDNIDCDAATRRGIVVMNTPGGNTVSTAEHTMSMLLSLSRNIPQAFESLRKGEWERGKFVGTELQGKTIGIIGLGKIGREVAQRCQAFGLITIGFDPVLAADVAAKLNIELVALEELYRRSDFITVHTPLNDETRGLINDSVLGRCKQGVRLINCARGGIIDEGALLRGLESGRVAGAALDVFVEEPPRGNRLLMNPRVIATPHLGASTEEAQEKVARQIAIQISDMLKERGIVGAINADVVQMSLRQDIKPFVHLAEKLGSLAAQLAGGKLKRITVTTAGPSVTQSGELISAAVLKGVLSHHLTEPVNLINAPVLAREMGVVLSEHKEADGGSYTHLIKVEYESEQGKRIVAGTVFGSSHPRIVRVDEYFLEILPEGNLLFYRNIDRPGMLAGVGAVLAAAGINIGGLALGRNEPGERAVTIINIDTPIPSVVLENLEEIEGVFEVKQVKL
ncbi:MAG: phosphoglycerate dehydrogenase [Bacteroidota bacterium]